MLTKEEQDIVVKAMRKYPAGVDTESWGKSSEFFYILSDSWNSIPKPSGEIQDLEDSVLLEHG